MIRLKFLYHANCQDGFAAAFIFWVNMPEKERKRIDFIPVKYGENPPDGLEGCEVIIADFSYKRPVLVDIYSKVKFLLVLDHHKTAQAELEDLDYCIFDMDKSGCRLVQEYFRFDEDPLIKYIEDRDLWRFQYEETRPVTDALNLYPFDFEVWENLDVDNLIQEGKVLARYKDQRIASNMKHFEHYSIRGHDFVCINCTEPFIVSDLGAAIGSPSAMYTVTGDKVLFSLRSRDEFDVSEVARSFGGGGHKNAAGFSISHELFYKFLTEKVI